MCRCGCIADVDVYITVGHASHLVHCVASDMQNVDTLFFILVWEWYGFHKRRDGTHYAKLVFLHPVRIPEKARWDMLH
jgi:hypothetical protein